MLPSEGIQFLPFHLSSNITAGVWNHLGFSRAERHSDRFKWFIRVEKQVWHEEDNVAPLLPPPPPASETLFMSNTTPWSHSASIQDFITPNIRRGCARGFHHTASEASKTTGFMKSGRIAANRFSIQITRWQEPPSRQTFHRRGLQMW